MTSVDDRIELLPPSAAPWSLTDGPADLDLGRVFRAFGGVSVDLSIFWGFVLVAIVIGVLAVLGRRRQKRAQADRAEQIASRSR